ncbi:Aste57867_8655 [Aphanomyces stellatus]|uniref:Aste57867_8655 protein n=1 Tax=Aphanomyces stellatus TaxID=120398 RepID=A0A485KKZ9_9STRA|nr:hypothetical protein As57867_008621 [Aphanomyces stellatus]VFT85541.1 Aste57867_8655 [Aphanomyces stellatus]
MGRRRTAAETLRDPAADEATKKAKRIQRRGYIRKMMQAYRGKERQERDALRAQVDELERDMQHFLHHGYIPVKGMAMLPWREVAAALHEDKSLVLLQQRALTKQVQDAQALLRDMRCWVAAQRGLSLATTTRTWRNVTLLANPVSRARGKEWIMAHMLHNMEAMFHHHGFSSWDGAPLRDTDLTFSDDGAVFTNVTRMQYALPPEFPAALSARLFRDFLCDTLSVDGFRGVYVSTIKEMKATTTLHQMTTTTSGEAVNLLCGQFHPDANRVVVVAQQIHDDEAWVHGRPQKNRMLWFERTTSVCGARSAVRFLYIMQQTQLPSGEYVSLADDARTWGGDLSHLPPATQQAKFRQGSIAYGEALRMMSETRRPQLIARMMQRGPPPATPPRDVVR